MTTPLEVELAPAMDTAADAAPAAAADRDNRRRVVDLTTRYAAIVMLALLLIVSTILNGGFWDINNLRNIATQNAPIALVALGLTFVIVGGVFDLSVGSLFAAGSVVYALLVGDMSIPLAALLTLLIGAGAGLVNGLVVTRLRVNPFIGTIGTGAVFSGFTYIICNSSPVQVNVDGFGTLGLGLVGGVPWPFIIVVALLAVGSFVMAKTVFGRYVYASGGNGEAARLAGIPVKAVHVSAYVIVAVLTVLAGMVTASQLGVGQPTLGVNTALDAFAIVVIGGTSVYGGEGSLWRTAIGVLILAVLNNLFDSMAWDTSRQLVAKGIVLVGAVALDAVRRRNR